MRNTICFNPYAHVLTAAGECVRPAVRSRKVETSMARTIPVSVIQRNIYDQLQASREIFEIIPELASVAEKEQDEDLKLSLENVMQKLMDIGEGLSDEASSAGEKVLDIVRSAP